MMNTIDLLSNVEIFRGLDRQQLDTVKECCRVTSFNEGGKIFSDGEEAVFIWGVIEGEVDLRFDLPGRDSSKETSVATITPGKVFGWSSFVPPYKYRLSAYATKDCKLIEIKKDCINNIFEKNALIGFRVMSNMSIVIGTRFQQLQDEVALSEGDKLLHQKDN
jgi:CRP/FNR family transcriptional regulator, cyclic AMP receptor protein